MPEYGCQIVLAGKKWSREQVEGALTPRCELDRLTNEIGLPLEGWVVNVTAGSKESVGSDAFLVCERLGVDPEGLSA